MSSARVKKQPKKYDGWKEPKIAISFLNHSHVYYGVVWGMIVVFLLFAKNWPARADKPKLARRIDEAGLGRGHLAAALTGLINSFKRLSGFNGMILIVRTAFLLLFVSAAQLCGSLCGSC